MRGVSEIESALVEQSLLMKEEFGCEHRVQILITPLAAEQPVMHGGASTITSTSIVLSEGGALSPIRIC